MLSKKEAKLTSKEDTSQIDESVETTKDQTLDNREAEIDNEMAEKEKLLTSVRQYAISMTSDIKDLLKNEWAGSIDNLEGQKKKAEMERKENLTKAKDDEKKIKAIEQEYSSKMENLNKELKKIETEKKKKEESV